jgi:hypothetical protein
MRSKVTELVIMGGGYPSGYSFNFWGSGNPSFAAHVINTWDGRMVFIGDDVGRNVKSAGPLMSNGPLRDPVRMAYIYYSYYIPRPSWDPLTILYGTSGLGDLFEFGNKFGRNYIEPDGTNRWIWDSQVRNQFFLRLKVKNETAATKLDQLLLQGANLFANRLPPSALSRDSLVVNHEQL